MTIGHVAVRLGRDGMNAEAQVSAGDVSPSPAEIRAYMASQGVLFGISDEGIARAIAEPGSWVVVAEGQPARKPVHGRVEFHFTAGDRPRVAIDEDGTADLKELGLLENVTAGHLLCTLLDPVAGAPGRNVRGELVFPEEARTATLNPGKNVIVSPDGRELHAAIDGRVVLDRDGSVSVENVFTVSGDAGPATGNINFLGSVVVTGNVCSDYRVKAAQKIIVGGAVEGAVLEAGQEIVVKGGVSGAGKALLQCPGNIRVRHAQDARIFCGGTLTVDQDLLRVTAVAAHSIVADRGAIVGGCVTAPVIKAARIGSDSETHTVVEFGISPRTKLICTRLEGDFLAARERLIRIRRKLQPLQAAHNAGKILSGEDRSLMEALEVEQSEMEAKILAVAGDVKHQVGDPSSDIAGELAVTGSVHPGVILSTCRQVRPIQKEVRNLLATANEGKMAGGSRES